VQEEDDESEDARLRAQDEPAPDGEPPDPSVLERVSHVAQFLVSLGRLAEPAQTGKGRNETPAGERDEPAPQAPGGCDRRQRERRGHPSERYRRLADPEGKAALPFLEPAHDGAPARRVDTGSQRARHCDRRDEDGEGRSERGRDEPRAGPSEPGGQHGSLADPIRKQPPGK